MPIRNREFIDNAVEAGFTIQQAEFMAENVAKFPHTHTSEEVVDLDETIAEFVGGDDEIEDEDTDDEEV